MFWPDFWPDFWPNQAAPVGDALPFAAGLFLLLLAPALGSFLGVLVDRLPRGEDVLWAPSRCRSCAQRLQIRDLLPILSFVWMRGRCRSCGAAIPPWSLYLEIIATGCAVLALAAGGSGVTVLMSCLFLWGLLALALCDLLWLRLPDPLTLSLAGVVLIWAWLGGRQDLGLALLGAGLGSTSFLALRLGYQKLRHREGLGLGDVKLMVGLGGFAGPFDLPLLVLVAALLALVKPLAKLLIGGLASLLLSERGRERQAAEIGQQALPFGTALCAAAALLWLARALGGLPF
ncbi:prepilin peptidase [Pseudophaeobacter arcticus]|uniref:prepilin peptidase n=1 Tax=Pseudophaeobacter arcticus TaxID=385492 RepID=UPI000405FA08|nr:A24 family peptidase [Pseudophaeobacter arcticus]